MWVQSLGQEDPLEEGRAAHSSFLAWRILWTEEPGRLQSVCAQSCPTLCNLMDHNPPVSSVNGIFLARILEWIAMPSSRGSSQPRDQTHIFCIASGSFYCLATREAPG